MTEMINNLSKSNKPCRAYMIRTHEQFAIGIGCDVYCVKLYLILTHLAAIQMPVAEPARLHNPDTS